MARCGDATLLTPATTAFSIWTVIYLGLIAYLVWQWLPGNAANAKARATGWWAAASLLLNGVWLGVTQAGWLWVSVLVIAVLAFVLGKVCVALVGTRPDGPFELIALYLTFGLYLGWVCVATVANITAAAVGTGVQLNGVAPIVAVGVLLVAGGLGVICRVRCLASRRSEWRWPGGWPGSRSGGWSPSLPPSGRGGGCAVRGRRSRRGSPVLDTCASNRPLAARPPPAIGC